MTDNEIIKALECCSSGIKNGDCGNCPFNGMGFMCITRLTGLSLSLINRQKAEIERLKAENENLKSYVSIEFVGEVLKTNHKERIKAEAIKEFAERLKEEQEFFVNECDDFVGYVSVNRIDNLVKEMVGDGNEN